MKYGHAAVAALIDKGEWQIDYVYDAGGLTSECLCGKDIRYEHFVRNLETDQVVVLGSTHAPWLVETAHNVSKPEAKRLWGGMLKQYKARTREPVKGWAVFRAMVPTHRFSNLMWERHQSGGRLTKNMRDKLREIIEERRATINARLRERANALRMEAEADMKKRFEAAEKAKRTRR